MKTFRVSTDGQGNPRIEALALPFLRPGPAATPAELEQAPDPATFAAVEGVRAVSTVAGSEEVVTGAGPRRLILVVSGSLRLGVPDMSATAGPGDVVFVDLPDGAEHPATISSVADGRYLEVEVGDAWVPRGVVPPSLDEDRRQADADPQLTRLYSEGDLAHLGDLSGLFTDAAAPQDAYALTFICLSPGMDSDFHTEPDVSLVFVLSGGFTLEVGGSGGRQTLRAGDVGLVEDFEGQGHASSVEGETRFAVLTLPREHQWK